MEGDEDEISAKYDWFLVYVGQEGTHTGWTGKDFSKHPIAKYIFNL